MSATAPADHATDHAGLRWRPDIQGLRAVAVGGVLLAHAGWDRLEGGVVGVDVFFVISGFLITSLLLREADPTGRISLAGFYARRARRILPASTLVAVVTLVAGYWILPLTRIRELAVDGAWSVGFLANVRFAAVDSDYWNMGSASPFRHYWSLAVEEQFYLVWPVLLIALLALARRRVPLILTVTALSAASVLWSVIHTAQSPLAGYYDSPARAYELLLGALLALASGRIATWALLLRRALGLAGLAGIATTMLALSADAELPGWLALAPTLAASAVIAGGIGPERTPAGLLLSLPPIRYAGAISYSLYLWHWPVLALGSELLDGWSARPRVAVLLTLSLALATTTYHLIERPLMSWSRIRPSLRSLLLWPVSVALVLGCAVGVAHAAGGTLAERRPIAAPPVAPAGGTPAERAASVTTQLAQAVTAARAGAAIPAGIDFRGAKKDIWFKHFTCAAWWSASTSKICPMGARNAKRTVVLLGDSHAGMWLYTLDSLGKQQNFRVVPLLKHACSAFDYPQTLGGKSFKACTSFRKWARSQIASLHPSAVVAASRGYLEVKPPRGTSVSATWSAGVTKSVKALRGLTSRVVVLSDLPSRGKNPVDCAAKRRSTQKTCLASASGSKEASSNRVTKTATRKAGGSYVDTTPLVCQKGYCPALVGTRFVYFDDNHMSKSWSETVVPSFAALVGRL